MPDPTKNAIKDGDTWYPFISLSGQVQSLAQTLTDISRPGTDGTAVQESGKKGEPFEMIGIVDCNSQADAVTLAVTLQGLQGKIVGPLLDAYGGSSSSVIVWKAERVSIKAVLKAVGGLSTNKLALLTMRFILQRPTAPGV